jgi:hypothetical protein
MMIFLEKTPTRFWNDDSYFLVKTKIGTRRPTSQRRRKDHCEERRMRTT